ncbi:MAG: chemotaxis response regulator protein-glutamate methylesterase [Desulfobulbaceae bacterium A2]|nr:MAG: chemotaxis response regulator protein-glutamate methylesterase [Desulfobulbaceae bacterium A2]
MVRVLVVDDSPLVCRILSQGLALDPGIEVVGTAPDPYAARDMIVRLRPDVLTLDVEMPRMNGVEFLRRLMPQYPLPVVMVSSLTQQGAQVTFDALEAGAVDFVGKPSTEHAAAGLSAILEELRDKVTMAAQVDVSRWRHRPLHASTPAAASSAGALALARAAGRVIAIGASTGGVEALRGLLVRFPAASPPVVVVQHMPAGFTAMFSQRLNQLCAMEVKEAATGDRLLPGRVLVAPGGMQTRLMPYRGGGFKVECGGSDKVSGHCPSVDVLLYSVAEQVGEAGIGIMLTGMGADGAGGMLAMRQAGSRTLAQDEASCVVFGMPRVAFERGGAERLVPLTRIADEVMGLLGEGRHG